MQQEREAQLGVEHMVAGKLGEEIVDHEAQRRSLCITAT
jgi:hypothetical protein